MTIALPRRGATLCRVWREAAMAWWWLVAMSVVSAAFCRFAVRRARRYRQWLGFLSCFALPAAIVWLTFLVADHFADRYVTCNAPDCGPIMMIALGDFVMIFVFAGLVGSIAGVVWGAARPAPHDDPRTS
jgi:hypothetical protein